MPPFIPHNRPFDVAHVKHGIATCWFHGVSPLDLTGCGKTILSLFKINELNTSAYK
jgi:hypothetical protein